LIDILALNKKWTLFRKIGFKCSEIDFGWIGFYLAEIRIDCEIKSEII